VLKDRTGGIGESHISYEIRSGKIQPMWYIDDIFSTRML
jgi:hypothetical protein